MPGEWITGAQALHIICQVGATRIDEFPTHEAIILKRGAIIRHFHRGGHCQWQLDPTNYQVRQDVRDDRKQKDMRPPTQDNR